MTSVVSSRLGAPCPRYATFRLPLAAPARRHRAARRPRQVAQCFFSPQDAFSATTVAALPLYGLMMAAPQRRLTQRLLGSDAFFLLAAAVYAAHLWLWGALPALLAVARASWSAGALPSVAAFATCFHSPPLTALAWLHLVMLDLFQARWVYLDGLRRGVPTAHSLGLCFMVGPLGLLSHLVTCWATERSRRGGQAADGTAATAAAA